MTHGDLSCGDIQDHFGNEERIESGGSVTQCEIGHFFLEGDQAADPAGEDDAYPVGVNVLFADTGIFDRFITGDECELAITVDLTGFFAVEVLGGIKILNLTGKPCLKLAAVELFDIIAAADPAGRLLPIFIDTLA